MYYVLFGQLSRFIYSHASRPNFEPQNPEIGELYFTGESLIAGILRQQKRAAHLDK